MRTYDEEEALLLFEIPYFVGGKIHCLHRDPMAGKTLQKVTCQGGGVSRLASIENFDFGCRWRVVRGA